MEIQTLEENVSIESALRFEALEYASGLPPSAANISRAAAKFGTEAASWAFTQWQLRKSASKKFSRAAAMLFTRAGLEQSTHEVIASYRASRFPSGETIGDLCCGIGGDLLSLGKRGPAVAYEIDEETAFCARHNVRVYDAQAMVKVGDVLMEPWDFDYAVSDPSRRSQRGKESDPQNFSPDPLKLLARLRTCKLAAMKLSPMIDDQYLSEMADEIEFISYGAECREAVAWIGGESTPGVYATHVESGEKLSGSDAKPIRTEELHGCFYEADPAAIRAHCLATLCEKYSMFALGDSNGYLSSSELVDSVWLDRYTVIDCGSYDRKRVKASLKSFGGGTPIIKTRSKNIPQNIEKELKTPGHNAPIIALYESGKSLRFALLERV